MRIIGGTHRGTRLSSVGAGDQSAHLRPTPDRVRESLFNLLQGGRYNDPLTGAVVLDLFAGTGAMGLEALSRGAAGASFVDNGRKSGALLRENIGKLYLSERSEIYSFDALRPPKATRSHDLVFLDPPYGKGLGGKALSSCREAGWIAQDALILFEEAYEVEPPIGFTKHEARRYGATTISILSP